VEGRARPARLYRLQPECAPQDDLRRLVSPCPTWGAGVYAIPLGRAGCNSARFVDYRERAGAASSRGRPVGRYAPAVTRAAAGDARARHGGRASRRRLATGVPEDARRAAASGAKSGEEDRLKSAASADVAERLNDVKRAGVMQKAPKK